MNRNPLLLERLRQLSGNSLVLGRDDPRQQLEDRHLAPEASEDRCELDADGAAAEDDERARHFAKTDGFVARDDARVIDLDAGNASRSRAGRDHDFFGRSQRLRVAVCHFHAPATHNRRCALDPLDLVLLEQKLDAFGEAAHDLVLARLHLVHVDADGALGDGDAPLLDVPNHLQRVRMLEQRFRRNAAPDEACPAECLLLLDNRHLQSELRRTNRSDVAAGSRANHHHVEVVRHPLSNRATYWTGGGLSSKGPPPRSRYNTRAPADESEAQDCPHRRRRRGDAGHAQRDPAARLSRAARGDGRGGARDPQPRRRRPHAARRAAAGDRRLRRPRDRQGELRPHRSHHDLGHHRDRDRGAGDEVRARTTTRPRTSSTRRSDRWCTTPASVRT